MTIIEGMKELKLIIKKMGQNAQQVQQYAAQPSNEVPYCGDGETQKKEVVSLVQSTEDLAARHAKLSAQIAYTNLTTNVEIGGMTKSIHEWLQYRRGLIKGKMDSAKPGAVRGGIEIAYAAMNDNLASQKLNGGRNVQPDVTVARYYDEKSKMDGWRKWSDTYEMIDPRLEVVNATTELLELASVA